MYHYSQFDKERKMLIICFTIDYMMYPDLILKYENIHVLDYYICNCILFLKKWYLYVQFLAYSMYDCTMDLRFWLFQKLLF